MSPRLLISALLAVCLACGSKSAAEVEREAKVATEITVEGGASPFQAHLSQRSPEAMAIQEVPFSPEPAAERHLEGVLARYRKQWTFLLTIEPRSGKEVDPQDPFALDIENNGGQWGDRSRNLQRLLFEMGGFIRLRMSDGKEIEPVMVEFQRTFGTGLERSFSIVFPRQVEGKAVVPPFSVRVKEFGQGMGTLEFAVNRGLQERSLWRVKQDWKKTER